MRVSAGILPYRETDRLEVLVAHPGGPFFARKHLGAWSVVKGEVDPDEQPIEAARREFEEETGWAPPEGDYLELGTVTLRSGKRVVAWAVESDFDPATLEPGHFQMSWRGAIRSFPEIDRVAWVGTEEATELLNPAQAAFVGRLTSLL